MQTHSTVTHHRVDLVKGLATLLDVLDGDTKLLGKFLLLLLCLRNELVERRVKQTEDNRLAVHNLHGALGGSLDVWLKLGESGLSFLIGVAEDHLAQFCERLLGVRTVEHVLDTEQADALGSEAESLLSVLRGVGISPDTDLAELVNDGHELYEHRVLGSVHRVDLISVDKTLRAVEAHPVSLLEGDFAE
ncbi:unknown [Alistipes sp. CAG:514]|nr:unknown [Alistipes sp. CAG:514]